MQVPAAPPRAAPVGAGFLARAQDLFRSLDRNGDGVVSRTECGESSRTPRRKSAMEGWRKVRDKLLGRKCESSDSKSETFLAELAFYRALVLPPTKAGGGCRFLMAMRKDATIAALFHLPERIRQEDGTRDAFERVFQGLDTDGSGPGTDGIHEFAQVSSFTVYQES